MAIRWDKFTVKAQEAVQRASELASEHGNPELMPVHLLAALMEDKEGIVELDTVTVAGPGKAVSVAEIAAVSCVALTNAVWRGEPFQFTTSPLGTKLAPFTVRVIPAGLQDGVVFDDVADPESDVIVGRAIGNEIALERFALDAGLATATWTVSTEVKFAAATVAVSWVGLTYVVASCVRLLLLSTH